MVVVACVTLSQTDVSFDIIWYFFFWPVDAIYFCLIFSDILCCAFFMTKCQVFNVKKFAQFSKTWFCVCDV